ncbi:MULTISPECIES: hypothetical protein [Moorena]|nr:MULTISPECIES: hypothetical protein [Moorena]NER91905.1 hypothetical protein [Moorena sp. SIO3A2]
MTCAAYPHFADALPDDHSRDSQSLGRPGNPLRAHYCLGERSHSRLAIAF